MIGLTSYSLLPFIKAGLPVKPVPALKEGTYGTGGSGNLAIIKNAGPSPMQRKFSSIGCLSRDGRRSLPKRWAKPPVAGMSIPNGCAKPG